MRGEDSRQDDVDIGIYISRTRGEVSTIACYSVIVVRMGLNSCTKKLEQNCQKSIAISHS